MQGYKKMLCKQFGGITVVLCGDFRQILPVIVRGERDHKLLIHF